MTRQAGATERLVALRRAGLPELAPLWIEGLPAEEALDELGSREGPIFRLQEARFLFQMKRAEEAGVVLGRLAELPAGLDTIRKDLRAALGQQVGLRRDLPPEGRSEGETVGPPEDDLSSVTLAELYATQGEAGAALAVYERLLAAAPGNESLRKRVEDLRAGIAARRGGGVPGEAALVAWLERVRGWRRVLLV